MKQNQDRQSETLKESLPRGNKYSGLQEIQELESESEKTSKPELRESQISSGYLEDKRRQRFLKISAVSLAIVPLSIVVIGILMLFARLFTDVKSRREVAGAIDGIDQGLYAPIQNVYFSKQNCSQGYEQANLGRWSTKNFTIWNGYSVCFQRLPVSAYSKIKPSADNSSRQCSPGVWVSSSLQCPITYIEISNQSLQNSSNQSSFILDNGLYLNVRRETDKPPIIGFRLTITNSYPCLDPEHNPTELDFILNTIVYSECKPTGKYPNVTQFDSIRARKAFSDQPWGENMGLKQYYNQMIELYNAYLYYLPSLQLVPNDKCFSYNGTQISTSCQIPKYDYWHLISPLIYALICISLVTGALFISQAIKLRNESPQSLSGIIGGNRLCFSFMSLMVLICTYIYFREATSLTTCSNQLNPLEDCLVYSEAKSAITRVTSVAKLSTKLSYLLIAMSAITIIFLSISALTSYLAPKSQEKSDLEQKNRESEELLLMKAHRVQLKM